MKTKKTILKEDDVMPFGYYRGSKLGDLLDIKPRYLIRLHEAGVISLEDQFYIKCSREYLYWEFKDFKD